jgi:hypothetical protein
LQWCSCTDHRLVASARQLRCYRCKRVSRTTAGLRQPLLVARAQIAAEKRLRFATAFCIPRGAHAPRSWCSANVCRRKNDFCDARTHVPKSGGRQPAVGLVTQLQLRTLSFRDRRQPAAGRKPRLQRQRAGSLRFKFAYREHPRGAYAPRSWCSANVCRGKKTICAMHERTFPGAAGVSPPWWVIQRAIAKIEHCSPTRERTSKSGGCQPAVGMSNAVATVSVHRPPTGRLCATIAVLPLQTRFSNHGWLTSSAPDCPRADCCRKAVAIGNGVLYPTGGLRPRSWCSANVCRRKNDFCDARTRIPRSGGRQPAVVGDTTGYRKNRALFADSRTYQQERRASARRGCE